MEKFNYALAVVVALLGIVSADNANINLEDLQKHFPGGLPELPGGFPQLPGGLQQQLDNPNDSIDKAKTLLKEKCIKVAGEQKGNEAYQAIESGGMELMECAQNIVNVTAIQQEIAEASPKGELDVVFHKYCEKRPQALTCIENFNAKLVPCLEEEERKNQNVVMGIVKSLLNFICHKGGDQIALFIAEKGPECLQSKSEDIQQCFNSTFAGYMPEGGVDKVDTLPKFVIGEKQCEDIQKLENCVVKALEGCSEITPANIVESMFRFIKNETICNKPKSARHQHTSGSTSSFYSFNSLLLLLSCGIFYFALNKVTQ